MGAQSITLTLDNKSVLVPKGWEDLELSASFGTLSGQPNINVDAFTFQNDAAQLIIDRRKSGLSGGLGIFEGIPANMVIKDEGLNQVIFNGYLDLVDDYEEIEPQFNGDNPVQVRCKFVDSNALDSFETVISGISFAYLDEQGVFTSGDYVDLPFIIEESFNPLEIATTAISIYTLEQALEDAIARVASAIATVVGVSASGITGPVAGAALGIALAAVEVALAIALVALIVKLVLELIDTLLSPVRYHKCTPLSVLITKALNFFGYKVETNLTIWQQIHYLPSSPGSDSENLARGIFPEPPIVRKGIPKSGDFGYFITEMLDIVRNQFGARIDVRDEKVLIYNESDPIWRARAAYTMPKMFIKGRAYNTQELAQTVVFSARTDLADVWTIENYTGNAYEIKTEPKTVKNPRNVNIKGLQTVDFGAAWATRKDELNNLEQFLRIFTDAAGGLLRVLGTGKKLREVFDRRVGMMKVSSSAHSVPKLVLLSGGEIPANHRSVLSARAIADRYYKHLSFVDDTNNAQREVYTDVEDIPFTLSDFQKMFSSSNFTTASGAVARMRSIRWQFGRDKASADFDVQVKYTNNLREIKIEQNG